MKKIILIIAILICVFVIVGINLQKKSDDYQWKSDVSNDAHLIYFVSDAFHEICDKIYSSDDEESINLYNDFFDGNIHYLHDIDENSELGKLVLQIISRKAYNEYAYDINSFEEYEYKIKTVEDKVIAIQYKPEGYLYITIPNSIDTYNNEIGTADEITVKDGKYKF